MTLVLPFGQQSELPFRDDLARLSAKRECPILSLVADMDPAGVEALRTIVGRLSGFDRLAVLLESPGGHYDDAHRMLLALRRHVSEIEILVPFWAKSAATFFCLGADTIQLGPDGELGPLDPQIIDRSGNSRDASALETFKGLGATPKLLAQHLGRSHQAPHAHGSHGFSPCHRTYSGNFSPLS